VPLIQKIAPRGIDINIDKLQVKLFDGLGWDSLPSVTYESNHRAYKNETSDGIIPEVYDGIKEYREVVFNDKIDASSFFLVDDSRSGESPFNTTVSVIFQLKLDKIFPNVTHRADEEAHADVLNILKTNQAGAKISSLVVGLSNVYSGLIVDTSKYNDMQPFHVFKVDMDVNYSNC